MGIIKDVKTQTLGEEIANSISHGIGAGLSVAALVLVIVKACFNSTAIGIVSASIYGASLVILYLFSCLYHALAKTRARKVFQVLDHCSIYILIVGTYAPFSLVTIGGGLGWTVFSINLACMTVGIVFTSINVEKFHKISMILYVVMGWLIVISLKPVLALGKIAVTLLVLGGVLYTVGIVFYKIKKLKYFHFIWHIFVLGGSILQFFSIYFFVY